MKIKSVQTYQTIPVRGTAVTFVTTLDDVPSHRPCIIEYLDKVGVLIKTKPNEEKQCEIIVPFSNIRVVELVVESEVKKYQESRNKIKSEQANPKLQDLKESGSV